MLSENGKIPGSRPIAAKKAETVTSLASGADVRTDDALSIRGGDVAGSEDKVRTWVRNLGFGK